MSTHDDLSECTPAKTSDDQLTVLVRSIVYQAQDINSYELVDPDGRELPPFTPGSHIDLFFRDGRVRQYSLCGDVRDPFRYVIGVQREQAGRGGSQAIFDKVHVGRLLNISHPRNNFSIAAADTHHLLLAGGVGITPLLAMARHFAHTATSFELHYFVRTRRRAAFTAELGELVRQAKVQLHIDDEVTELAETPVSLVAAEQPGTHLYFCGPPGFMTAVSTACALWPREQVHFEYFKAPDTPALTSTTVDSNAIAVGFRVRVVSTGQEFDIPDDKSIVQVLREQGIQISTSCEAGLCATCKTRYLEGTPVHLDYVLDEQERLEFLLPCCSRATPDRCLVLDL